MFNFARQAAWVAILLVSLAMSFDAAAQPTSGGLGAGKADCSKDKGGNTPGCTQSGGLGAGRPPGYTPSNNPLGAGKPPDETPFGSSGAGKPR